MLGKLISLSIFSLVLCRCGTLDVRGITVEKHENAIVLDGSNVKNMPTNVDVTDIGDLISRSFWAGPMKENPNIELASTEPKANLLVVNFGTNASLANDLGDAKPLDYDFFPADSVSLLTSISTSEDPSRHGVVGKEWVSDGENIDAYSEPSSFASKLSFPQVIESQHPGSKVISASANPKHAHAFSQKQFPIDTLDGDRFHSHHGLGFSKKDLDNAMETEEFWLRNAENVQNLTEKAAVIPFFMEIEYLRRLSLHMKVEPMPVLYNLATTTPPFSEAQAILKDALDMLTTSFSEVHPDGNSQLVFMKEPEVTHNKRSHAKVLHHHPVQFSMLPDYDGTSNTTSYAVVTDARGYQISIWLIFFTFLALVSFSYQFGLNMQYEKDSRLFTTWTVGEKKGGMGMGSGPDMRAFNIRN